MRYCRLLSTLVSYAADCVTSLRQVTSLAQFAVKPNHKQIDVSGWDESSQQVLWLTNHHQLSASVWQVSQQYVVVPTVDVAAALLALVQQEMENEPKYKIVVTLLACSVTAVTVAAGVFQCREDHTVLRRALLSSWYQSNANSW